MKIKFVFFLGLIFLSNFYFGQTYPALNFTMVGHINPETIVNSEGYKYSGCWGWYQSAKNKEYAIACSQGGTYWIDMTNPFTPTVSAYKEATRKFATWREARTYGHYCYVICDDAGTNSFQIFDMQYLPDSIHTVVDSKELFSRGHTLSVDGDKLYVASVTYSTNLYSSLNVYSLVNPESPVLLRSLSQDYPFINRVHDMYVRKDSIYASCEFQGLYVFKLTTGNVFSQIGSLTSYTAAGYNHSSSLSPDGKTLVFTDEIPNGLPIKVANVSNLSNIQIQSTYNQFPQTTPHNPYVVNNQFCFVSSYSDGLQLIDISTPNSPTLAGYFDTFPQGGGNVSSWFDPYGGLWGAYPYQPSKTIFALDQLNGIFLLRSAQYGGVLTSIEELKQDAAAGLVLFPNPAQEYIRFNIPSLTKDYEVILRDAQGKMVAEYTQPEILSEGNNYRKVLLPKLVSGLYLFQVTSQHKIVHSKKIIISE